MSDSLVIGFAPPGGGAPVEARVARGHTVLDAAFAAGIELTATCGARGRCRSCRVKVLKGGLPPPTLQDRIQLGDEAVEERFRLACQTRLVEDCLVMPMPPRAEGGHQILGGAAGAAEGFELDSGVEKRLVRVVLPRDEEHQSSDLEALRQALGAGAALPPLELLRRLPALLRTGDGTVTATTFAGRILDLEPGDTTAHCYGMAIDLGTTSVVATLMDLRSGEQLAEVGAINPQAVHGADLMSRIAFAQFDGKKLATLRAKALGALNDLIGEATAAAGVAAIHVYKIVVVGNTCMHHLLLGIDVSQLGLAPYAPVLREPLVLAAAELPLKGAPNAQVCLLPIVAGFVGADTVACVLATRLDQGRHLRVLVDIGTNGEVVIGSQDRLVACSAPAGPAFEGAQIRHGMRGAAGAIDRVAIDGHVETGTIGGTAPIGICGSGLIDACAGMLAVGVLEPSGLLRRDPGGDVPPAIRQRLVDGADGRAFVLVPAEASGKGEAIALTQGDIRQLQLAKSAIYSAIVLLLRTMGVAPAQVEQLMLCGGFGNYLNIDSAMNIRLLPALPRERVVYRGNAALVGAQMALLSERERARAVDIAGRIEHVALASHPDFQDAFIEGTGFGRADEDRRHGAT